MKIFLYYKVDRGFYEFAYDTWRKEGGLFLDHLLRMQATLYSWKKEFEKLGCQFELDIRSSYLLPQTIRYRLPMPLAKLLRGGLWVTKLDPWLLQKDIIRRVRAYKPDIVFFPLGSSVWESTLQTLKSDGVRLVQWCGLPAGTMMERDRINLPYFDLIFQPYSEKLADGLRAAGATGHVEHIDLGFDPDLYRPMKLSLPEYEAYGSEVCFVGGLGNRYHSTRRKMIEYAIEKGIDLKIWGGYRSHFIDSPILNKWQGQVWGEEQVKVLCATNIGLNFHPDHVPGELDRGLNLRAFELPACGTFQLMHFLPGVAEYFEIDREIVCFHNQEEMLDKIKYYLAHDDEREAIAQAGRKRALREHTWTSRVRSMLKYMDELLRQKAAG